MNAKDRPAIVSLDEAECWDLLRKKQVGRLAVAANNKPDVFPVNFMVDEDHILIRTAPGHKFASAVLGDAVAFEVDTIDEVNGTGWSIVVKGVANEIEDLAEYLRARDLPLEPWAGGTKLRFLEIRADVITGRRIPGSADPQETADRQEKGAQ